MVASEGPVPSKDTVAELRQETLDALEDVVAAEDLHEEVQKALRGHLHALLEALDHLRVGGPSDVAAALKRLRCEIRDETEETKGHPAVARTVTVVRNTWLAFVLGGPATASAIEGWTSVMKVLPSGG